MQNLLDNLKNLLQKDERLVSEGEFFKNKVIELALKLDKDLIKLLLSDEKMKEVFFIEVDKILIFDKDKFIKFVSNKQFLPDSYTAFKNKIGLIDGDGEFISQKKEVVLSWPYKDCVLEGGMTKEDQKRDEIFWNEILAPDEISRLLDPKVFTNAKRIDKDGEHNLDGFKTNENGDIKDNLIIKGNNLLALHSLKKRFAGKVKLIYIDPPYNTGNDSFKYNDAFNHSSWLTFMKNRLEVAKDLLRDDGVIFTQCDDNEQAYLKVLMDEVFGRENFVNHVSVKVKSSAGFKTVNKGVMETSEYILIYAKNKKASVFNKIYRGTSYDTNYKYVVENPSETETNWKFSSIDEKIKHEVDKLKSIELDKKILNTIILELKSEYSLKNPDKVFRYTVINDDAGKETVNARDLSKKDDKIYKIETIKGDIRYIHKGNQITFYQKKLKNIDEELQPSEQVTNIWTDISWEGIANEGAVKLKKGKKPEKLIKRILELSTQYGDVVLDFFAGTGTTCAVAHKMGRQYVGVEQLDYEENDAIVRLKNVIDGDQSGISKSVGWKGGGDFVYLELAKWNENFVEKIQKAKTKDELKKLWETMKEKAFLSYKVDIKTVDENAKDFADLSIEDQKRFLLECLDKNHLYVNYSEIEDKEYGVSEEDKKLNREFYGN
jgi:adenine-specific DNA-methyltransferase